MMSSQARPSILLPSRVFSNDEAWHPGECHADIWSVAWSPDGRFLLTGCGDDFACAAPSMVRLWDMDTYDCVWKYAPEFPVYSVAWNAAAHVIAAASSTTIGLWPLQASIPTMRGNVWFQRPQSHKPLYELHIEETELSFDQIEDELIRYWAITGLGLPDSRPASTLITSITLRSDGQLLASASTDGMIRIWDWRHGRMLYMLQGHIGSISSVRFHPGEKSTLLASAGLDRILRLWDTHTATLVSQIQAHTSPITSVAWSPDGQALASAGYDGLLCVWNPQTLQCLQRLSGHSAPITCCVWSPDSQLLASTSPDEGVIRIWEPNTGKCLAYLHADRSMLPIDGTGAAYALAWRPDGHLIVGADDTSGLWFWELATLR